MSEENVVENEITYSIFVKKGRRHFGPQYVKVGAVTVQWIFPVPRPNTVGTLDRYSNGIVFINFGDYETESKCEVIAKDFTKEVCGEDYDYQFCPNFSEDTIAYSQTRIAVIANVKTGKAFHARCGLSIDDYMLGIRFLDPKENQFVIVKSIDEGQNTWEDYLHIAKLEDQQLVDTNWVMKLGNTDDISSDFPLYNTWLVHNHKLFVLDRDKPYPDQISCTDGRQSIPHPFSTIYNANYNCIGKIKDIALHPKLPFGVMIEERVGSNILQGLVIIRWDTNDLDEQVAGYSKMFEPLAPLFGLNDMALAYSSFSPCGNWYVVGCIAPAPNDPKNPHFIALSVNPEHPDLLDRDNIIILGQVKNMTSLAWTSDPTSYVVSNGELLHKWDLDELPSADVIVMPEEDDGEGKKSIFRRIGGVFGQKK